MKKPSFDIYDYVHNNDFTLKVVRPRNVTHVTKGYNDIRKTAMNEVKIKNGKFSLKESLDEPAMSNEDKKRFLEIISTYNTYQDQMKRPSDMSEIAETLGAIVDAAKELTTRSAGDWFDGVTIKRNMGELDKLDTQFQKFATDAKALDERLHALYEDIGHILGRYYQIADLPTDTMKERLAIREDSSKFVVMYTDQKTHKTVAWTDQYGKPKLFKDKAAAEFALSHTKMSKMPEYNCKIVSTSDMNEGSIVTEGNTPMVGSYVQYYETENGKKYRWYIEYIDSTHVAMGMKEPSGASHNGMAIYHIGQLRDKKFYKAMMDWMNTGNAKGIMNKVFSESVSKFKTLMLK